jgi:formate hydrogenlyase subunit 6/NADH:ubiquinone oxidoreductase subunit I
MNNAVTNYIDFYLIDPRWCIDCGSCAAICEENAIILNGIEEMRSTSYEEPLEYQLEELQSHF